MTGNPHITTELVAAVARTPYDSGRAGCPWDAVAPITQYAIKASALAFLGDAIPVMRAQGWRPPAVTITNREHLAALPIGSAVVKDGIVWQSEKWSDAPLSAADVLDEREGEFETTWVSGGVWGGRRSAAAMAAALPMELIMEGTGRA